MKNSTVGSLILLVVLFNFSGCTSGKPGKWTDDQVTTASKRCNDQYNATVGVGDGSKFCLCSAKAASLICDAGDNDCFDHKVNTNPCISAK